MGGELSFRGRPTSGWSAVAATILHWRSVLELAGVSWNAGAIVD